MLPPAVLWVDPGLMTGLALYRSGRGPAATAVLPAGFQCGEFDFMSACARIGCLTRDYGNRLAIGWERFTINANTHKKTPQPDALHMIGVCRYLSTLGGCRVLPEAQQATPGAFEQQQLRALGWWVPGKNDAQSAAAHMLRYLVKASELPPKERQLLATMEKGDG